MTGPVRLRFLGAGLIACLAVANACAVEAQPEAALASASLLEKIHAEVGDATCEGPQDCRSIAIGAKPCGGPDAYLAWSVRRSDEQRLRQLVERYAAARKEENQRSDANSTCVFETNPGVSCQNARCSLRPRVQGSLPPDDS